MTAVQGKTIQPGLLRGKLVRGVMIALAIAAVLIVVALIAYNQMRAQREQPIAYAVYPGAAIVSKSEQTGDTTRSDTNVYSTSTQPQAVLDFYIKEYGQSNESGCVRIPLTANAESTTPGDFEGRCIIDNSQDDMTQRLMINITWNKDQQLTFIEVNRDWRR